MPHAESPVASLIALDWGTTNLRAWLLDPSGEVIAEHQDARGMAQLQPAQFEPTFVEVTAPWRAQHGVLPAIACGMVGARQGWHEAPYVECPARFGLLARQVVAVSAGTAGTVHIVPGMCQYGSGADVMRGEETQLAGAVADRGGADDLVLLPGTHSKWVQLAGVDEQLAVRRFATHMTGELYAVLRDHSILGLMMASVAATAALQPAAFLRGCDVGRSQPALLNALFGTRAKSLLGDLPASDAADYLSGLLIGFEVATALNELPGQPAAVLVIGEGELTRRYLLALEHMGVAAVATANTARSGLFHIARSAGLLEETTH